MPKLKRGKAELSDWSEDSGSEWDVKKRSKRGSRSSTSSDTDSISLDATEEKRVNEKSIAGDDTESRITRRKSYINREILPDSDKKCLICDEFCMRGTEMEFLTCATCGTSFHGKCLKFDTFKTSLIRSRKYRWHCVSCKKCTNQSCKRRIEKTEKSVTCYFCDRKRHLECLDTTLTAEEQHTWACNDCHKARLPTKQEKKADFKCPIPGCDSKGHFSGKFDSHFTPIGCPKFHNLTTKEATDLAARVEKNAEMRAQAVSDAKNSTGLSQDKYMKKIAKSREYELPENMNDLVRKMIVHRETHGNNRESILQGITSDWDLIHFREAQMAVAVDQQQQFVKEKFDEMKIQYVIIGDHEIKTWYSSPYPEIYQQHIKIYVCEFCLKYMNSEILLRRHNIKCTWKHPPGNEIYRHNNLSVFEVDGKAFKTYCQNICLFAKMFLDHKTLWFDVEPFLFYVVTLADNRGCHIVGYFSKEKDSFYNYNLSCILTFPQYSKQGYGRFMIEFSYLLSKVENRAPGSPEKPLSDLGLASYRSYWTEVVMKWIVSMDENQPVSLKALSQETHVHVNDLVSTLQFLGLIKFWKGKHIIVRKQDAIDAFVVKHANKEHVRKTVHPECLSWNCPSKKK